MDDETCGICGKPLTWNVGVHKLLAGNEVRDYMLTGCEGGHTPQEIEQAKKSQRG